MDFTDQQKEDIERQIVEAIATALDKNELEAESLPEIATFILEKIDMVENQEQLLGFLRDLSDRWSVFKSLADIQSGNLKTDMEKKTANDVMKLASSGNIEEAISLAKSVTSNNQ